MYCGSLSWSGEVELRGVSGDICEGLEGWGKYAEDWKGLENYRRGRCMENGSRKENGKGVCEDKKTKYWRRG